MNPQHALKLRQHELLLRSQLLRVQFAEQGAAWRPPFAIADQLRGAWHWLRANPVLPVAAALVLAVVRPRRAWSLALRLWWGWGAWQRLQQRLQQRLAPTR